MFQLHLADVLITSVPSLYAPQSHLKKTFRFLPYHSPLYDCANNRCALPLGSTNALFPFHESHSLSAIFHRCRKKNKPVESRQSGKVKGSLRYEVVVKFLFICMNKRRSTLTIMMLDIHFKIKIIIPCIVDAIKNTFRVET